MDISTLERAWQQQTVISGDMPAELVASRLQREVAIAQRRIRGGIVLAAFVLFTAWTVAIVGHLTWIKPFTPLGLLGEAVGFILLVLFFIRAFHSARAVRSEIEMLGGTLQESLSATLRTVELQIQNAQIAVYAIPAVVAIAASLYLAKFLAGDLPGLGAAVGTALAAAFGAAIYAAIWYRHRTHLAPRQAELREILRSLDS